jgi:uncharacterized protein (DUF488 family)
MTIYTIGHSTRELAEFVKVLQTYKITQLVDVRSVPRSRHTPQFNEDHLAKVLPESSIAYIHLAALGGLRHTTKGSINLGWRNTSFRGYADYMQTPDFAAGIDELLKLAADKPTAIMCAEAVPWRCHRSLIGDALLVRGQTAVDIFDEKKAVPENLTSFAKVDGTSITYPEIV